MDKQARFLKYLLLFILVTAAHTYSQRRQRDQGHCPMCGQQWDGRNYYTPAIPDSIPAPHDSSWLKRLGAVMARERLSKAQYEEDAQKYSLHMPYNMVIPQEDDHIAWITSLYQAFGMQAPDSVPPLVKTDSQRDALRQGMQLEEELIPDYEWLIKNADKTPTKQILGDILYQTRMHYTMFQHALSMGPMMGARGHGPLQEHMGWGHMNWGWGGGIMMILWIVIIAVAIFLIIHASQKGDTGATRQESALDILKKRYARGEISKDEFEERKRDLM